MGHHPLLPLRLWCHHYSISLTWLHISVAILFAGFVAFTSSCKEALYQISLREAERHKIQKNSLNGVQRVFLWKSFILLFHWNFFIRSLKLLVAKRKRVYTVLYWIEIIFVSLRGAWSVFYFYILQPLLSSTAQQCSVLSRSNPPSNEVSQVETDNAALDLGIASLLSTWYIFLNFCYVSVLTRHRLGRLFSNFCWVALFIRAK